MGKYKELFKFAAKAGALEGYLYEREKLEPLHNWVTNIEKMYLGLSDDIKEGIKDDLSIVVKRTLTYGQKTLNKNIYRRLNRLLAGL